MAISILTLILCILALRCKDGRHIYEKRELTDMIKYIAALLVVNGHLFSFGGGPEYLAQELNIGPLCVSLFLFFSGYGLMHSYAEKGNAYLKGFISHRIGKVLLPLLTAYIVTLPVYRIVVGPFDWRTVFSTLHWGGPFLKFSWYVSEIVILYLLFFISMKLQIKEKSKIWLLTSLVFFLICAMIVTQQPIWYIESLPAFLIGIWFHKYEDKILVSKLPSVIGYLSAMTLCLILIISFRWHTITENLGILTAFRYQYAAYFIMNIVFVLATVIIVKNMPSPRKKMQFCRYYYEIYLMQNCAMLLAGGGNLPFPAYWLCTMILTLALSFLMHKANTYFMGLCYRA